MLRIIIITITLALFSKKNAVGQSSIAHALVQKEWEYFNTMNDSVKSSICFQKFDLYLTHKCYNADAFKDIERVQLSHLNEINKVKFLWNAALYYYINEDFRKGLYYINQYENYSRDSTTQFKLLQVILTARFDTLKANDLIQTINNNKHDSILQCLTCINKLAAYSLPKRKKFIRASSFLPGLGTLLLGYPLKGLTSFTLNSLSVYGIYQLTSNKLYFNAFGWGMALGLKLYVGNILLTEKLRDNKELIQKNKLAKNCELKIKEVLNKYPLNFK